MAHNKELKVTTHAKFLIRQILELDLRSDDFQAVYEEVFDKYWVPGKMLNEYNDRRALLMQFVSRAGDEIIQPLCEISNAIVTVAEGQEAAATGAVDIEGGKSLYFNFSSDPSLLDKLAKQLRNTVMVEVEKQNGASDESIKS